MQRILITIFLAVLSIACKEHKDKEKNTFEEPIAYISFGEKITDENVVSMKEMAARFEGLKEGDTIRVKFASSVNEVCKAKGCWMKLDLGDEKESMVRFTDYGFFVPLNSDHKEVIVDGRAYVTKITIKELRHYAEDAGKTGEEIAKITVPEFTYAFEADGVLIRD